MHSFLSAILVFSCVCGGLGQTNQNNNANNINQGNNNFINSNMINANSLNNVNMPPTSMNPNVNNMLPPPSTNPNVNNMLPPPSTNPNVNNMLMPNMNPNLNNMFPVNIANMMNMMNLTNVNMTNMSMADMINMLNSAMMNMLNNTMMNNGTMNMNNGTQQQQNLNVGNPDRGRIERPCETYDTDCIRRFFADRNKCKIVRGPIPDPFYRKQSVVYVPRVNLTVSLYDVRLTGFNRARIEEFYINRDTDKIVLAVEFRNVTVASNRTYLRFHRRGKEPVINKTNFTVTYDSLSLTGIIPQINHSLIDKTVIFPYSNTVPNYQFGPNAFVSTDPQVPATGVEFQANPRANTGEILLTDSTYYLLEYIQYRICDFGLKVL